MPNRTDQQPQQPTPVADDAHATTTQLQQRAATDYANAQAATRAKALKGGPGERQGILPSGTRS